MLSNLSDLLMSRVDPKSTQQVATAADSSAVLVNNPALRQFYSPQRGYTPVQTFAPGKVPAKYSFTPEQITDKVKSAVELNKQIIKTSGGKILNAYPGTFGAIQNAMRDEETKRKFYKDDAETATAKKNILNDKTGFANKYRFQTRDNIPNEINFAAPYNITDTRIAPQKTVLYESKTDPGAVTLIHQYDELLTTPWAKLNEKQKEARLKVPGGIKGTPYDPELKKRGFNPLPLPGKVVQTSTNPPAKAKYITSAKKSAQKASDAEIEKWLNQSGEEPVESSSSMVAMAPESTYIQNAPTNKRGQASIDAENFDRAMQNAGTEVADGQMQAQDPNSQYAYTQPYRVVNAYRRSGGMQGYTYPDKHPLSGKQLPMTFMVSPDGTIIDAGYQGKAGNETNTIWGYGDRIADQRENFVGKNISEINNSGMYSTFSEGGGFNTDYNPVAGEESLGSGFYRKIATNATKQFADPKGRRSKEQVAKEIQDLTSKKEANNWWNSISQKGPYSR